jgi:hypothetical protein
MSPAKSMATVPTVVGWPGSTATTMVGRWPAPPSRVMAMLGLK